MSAGYQSNTQLGPVVFPTPVSYQGYENLIFKLTPAGVGPIASFSDRGLYVLLDGGVSVNSTLGYQAAVAPLTTERNARAILYGSCAQADLLYLADPAVVLSPAFVLPGAPVGSTFAPNGLSVTSPAGMVCNLAQLGLAGTGVNLTPVLTGTSISGITVAGGAGYRNGLNITIQDATGTGALAVLNSVNGVPSTVTIINGGTGYTAPFASIQAGAGGVTAWRVGQAEQAGVTGQFILFRPDLGLQNL